LKTEPQIKKKKLTKQQQKETKIQKFKLISHYPQFQPYNIQFLPQVDWSKCEKTISRRAW